MGKHNHWLQKCIVYWLLIFKKNQRLSRPNYWLFSTHPTRKITVIFPIQLKNSRLFSTHSTPKITDFFTHRTTKIADCFHPIPLQKSPTFFTHPTIKSPIFSATRLTNPMGKCCYPFQVPSPLLAQDLVPLFLHRFLLLLLLHDHVCSSIEPTLAIFVSQSLHVDHQSSLEDTYDQVRVADPDPNHFVGIWSQFLGSGLRPECLVYSRLIFRVFKLS